MVKRRHGCPERIEAHGSAVGCSQVVDRSTVIVIRGRCGRRESPSHELIARTAKLIRREVLRRVIAEVHVRHTAVHRSTACVRLKYHRIRIRCINRMYRRIAGHRGTEGISRVVLILPVIEVVARLVLRLHRCREARVTVRHIVMLRELIVLVPRIRVRRILHRHGVAVNLPLRMQSCVRMNRRRAKRELRSRRIRPVEEVVARLLSRRGGRGARCIVLNRRHACIIAVAHALVCRGMAATLCVILHRETRQGVTVLKLQLGRRCACAAALLRDTSRHREGISRSRAERSRALRHRKGNRVDSGIVAVVLCGARGLL